MGATKTTPRRSAPAASAAAPGPSVAASGAALPFGLTIETLARLTGISAVVFGVLAAAGMLNTWAYLSAWGVPAPLVKLDPLTAALRVEETAYQVLMFGLIFWGLSAGHRRLRGRRWGSAAFVTGTAVVLALLSWITIAGGFPGPAITALGAFGLFAGYRLRPILSLRAALVLFVVVTLTAAAITGSNWGTTFRTQPESRTPLTVTTASQVSGLAGAADDDGSWHYEELYLIFRDDENLYVGSFAADGRTWLISLDEVLSLSIGRRAASGAGDS